MAGEQSPTRSDWLRPSAARLAPNAPHYAEVIERHDEAVAERRPTYVDPVSSLSVFTAAFLRARGYCCESGCRHCPYVQG